MPHRSFRARAWWLLPAGQHARCRGPSPNRSDNRCHNLALCDGLCKTHLRRGFTISAWGVYTKQNLLITCDSRESAETLLDPDETLVRVVAKCVPAKKGKR